MLDERVPSTRDAAPGPDVIVQTQVLAEHLAAPTVVIAGDPQHRNARLADAGELAEHPHAGARHGVPPLEPEVEQVPVDHERLRVPRQGPQEREQVTLGLRGGGTQVRVGEYIAGGGEHRWMIPPPAPFTKAARVR